MSHDIKVIRFPLLNASEESLGSVTLEHLWADVFALKIQILQIEALEQLKEVVAKALEEALKSNARTVIHRAIKGDTGVNEILQLLRSTGFSKKSERIEYRKAVGELPSDQGTLLTWKTAVDLGWRVEEIAEALKLVAEGDPDYDPSEDPLLFVQDFLADPVLTSGLHCVHFGFMDDEMAALTVVQIHPKSGWSRISYMGIAPKFRGQGLGKWVHRYSFQKMKEGGGKLYHGGTDANNQPMIALFEMHGCDSFREMEEWVLDIRAARR